MSDVIAQLREFVVEQLPHLIVLVTIVVVGWLIALIVSYMVRRALERTNLDDRIARKMLGRERAARINTARWAGRGIYYIILLLTLLAFLQATALTAASEPINAMVASVLAYIPRLFAAAAILFVGWLVATLARTVLRGALDRWEVDRRIRRARPPEPDMTEFPIGAPARIGEPSQPLPGTSVSRAIAETAYWLVLLLFLPAVLAVLRLEGILAPVQAMLSQALGFLPNIASALVIVGVGWLVARVVQRLVTNAVAGTGADRLTERVGGERVLGRLSVSSLVGFIAYILVLVPVAISALETLQLDAITEPASRMLQAFLTAVPSIFAAALVLAVAYAAGKLLSQIVSTLLNGIGFDAILARIGFTRGQIADRTPSDLVGGLVMITVLYLAVLEGARLLGFYAVVEIGQDVGFLAGHILLGLGIFGVGLYLSKLAADAVRNSDIGQARNLAIVTRIAILGLTGGMALRQMGIADEIIELAFGLVLGSVAVAVALAFGLGGREFAARVLEDMRTRNMARRPPAPPRPTPPPGSNLPPLG